MKRKVLAILLSGFLIFSLVACGSEKEENPGKANDTLVEDIDKDADKEEVELTEEEIDDAMNNGEIRFSKYNVPNKSIVKRTNVVEDTIYIKGYNDRGEESDSVTIGDYKYDNVGMYKEKSEKRKKLKLNGLLVITLSPEFVESNKKMNVSDTILNDVYSAVMNKDCTISDLDKAIENGSKVVVNSEKFKTLEEYLNFFIHYDITDGDHVGEFDLNGVIFQIMVSNSADNGGKDISFRFVRE